MPEDKNTVRIQALPAATPELLQPQRVAIGMPLAQLQYVVQLMADEHAPHFYKGQEPTQDGRAYKATDGRHYYRPQLRVAQRSAPTFGPDVRFLKDARGTVSLQFELEEVPPGGIPAGAQPFNVRVNQVRLRWNDGSQRRQRLFDQPTLVAEADQQGSAKSSFYIRVGAELAPEEVEPIYRALSDPNTRAQLEVALSYGYWVDKRPPVATPIDPRPPIVAPIIPVFPIRPRKLTQPDVDLSTAAGRLAPAEAISPPIATPLVNMVNVAGLRVEDLVNPVVLENVRIKAQERERQSNFRNVTLARTISFTFDRNLEQNRPIYSAIEGSESITESWTDTGFGLVRQAPFPNTVYRLPDEIRLAYNAELGTPHVIPVLYRDAEGEVRVRVTLRAVPWHNPDQLVKLRDFLHRASAGALANPEVVVGGYEAAALKLTSAFPEQIRLLNGDEVPISLEGGFDLTLDLSLEFYKFLAELLTGPVGLTGEVTVTLATQASEGSEPQQLVRRVPMRLNFDDLASVPVEVKADKQAVSPRQIQIINRARTEVKISNCVPRLLLFDSNSVVPLAIFEAMPTTPAFPAELATDAPLTVGIEPEEGYEDQLWNAVQVELIGQELVQGARQVLDRVHEVAPSGTLAWEISVECPIFLRDPIPENYQNLYRVEVQISRPGFAPQQVVLGQGQATGRVTMQRTLKDIVSEDAASLAAFNYRVRNIYYDHQGAWGSEQSGEGTSLFVFPNPVEND